MTWHARRPRQPDDDGRARDLTDGRREAELLAVSARLLAAQEDDRRRIARELHDDVSQRLALLSFELQRLSRVGSTKDVSVPQRRGSCGSAPRRLPRHRRAPTSSTKWTSTRELDRRLRRRVPDRCGGVRRAPTDTAIPVAYEAVSEPLSREVALCLFRIVEEGLANVVEHSAASEASVTVTGTGEATVLAIVDTGVGFDPDAAGLRGLGLPGMRHRLEVLGGSMRNPVPRRKRVRAWK